MTSPALLDDLMELGACGHPFAPEHEHDRSWLLTANYAVPGKWGSLPSAVAAQVLGVLAGEMQQASVLVAVSHRWRALVEASPEYQALFRCSIMAELALAERLEQSAQALNRAHPYQGVYVPLSIDKLPRSPRRQAQACSMHNYVELRQQMLVRRQVFCATRELAFARRDFYTQTGDVNIENTPAMWSSLLSVLLLTPQCLLWLVLRVDGLVNCPWELPGVLGLAACASEAFTTGYIAARAAYVFRVRNRLLKLLRTPSLAAPLPPKISWEALTLISCAHWACVIAVTVPWLFLLMHDPVSLPRMLGLAATFSCAPLMCSAGQLYAASWANHQAKEARRCFSHQVALTWLLAGLLLGHHTKGGARDMVFVLAAAGPEVALVADALDAASTLCSSCWRSGYASGPTTEGIAMAAFALPFLSLMQLGLVLICGRVAEAQWADKVPLTVLVAPFQLPLAMTSIFMVICLLWISGILIYKAEVMLRHSCGRGCARTSECTLRRLHCVGNRLHCVLQRCRRRPWKTSRLDHGQVGTSPASVSALRAPAATQVGVPAEADLSWEELRP